MRHTECTACDRTVRYAAPWAGWYTAHQIVQYVVSYIICSPLGGMVYRASDRPIRRPLCGMVDRTSDHLIRGLKDDGSSEEWLLNRLCLIKVTVNGGFQ